jgi:adhesin transport system outer membrane protein
MFSSAPRVGAQPLEAELWELLQTHPEILAREKTVEAAQQGVRKALAGYIPKVDIYGATGPAYIDSPIASNEGGGTWFRNSVVAGLQVKQKVFDGMATPAEVTAARLNKEIAEFTLSGTRQNVLFAGIDAYIEVLRQKRLLELARESERTLMQQLNLEDERVERGSGIAVDVLQAKSRLQIAKERRVAFEGGLADAIARYVQVFNHQPEPATMVEPKPPQAALPRDIDEAVAVAGQENPAIDASLATVAVAETRQKSAQSGYYPEVNVVGSASRETDNDLVLGTRRDLSVVLQATWNLFNGFATNASVKQAAFDYQASRQNHDMVVRKVDESTRLAWNELATARQRVDLLDNAVRIASEVFDARRKLREAGRETLVDVLDAENEVYNARINLTAALADSYRAAFRVLLGMGRLDERTLGLSEATKASSARSPQPAAR